MRFRGTLGAVLLTAALAASSLAHAAAPNAAAERERLKRGLDDVLQQSPLKTARVGVHVVSLDTGEVLYARDANELLNPASNVKLVTSAAALARLGPEYKFATEFYCSEALTNGRCGTLYVKGRGDPALYTERLYAAVGELVHRGVRSVGDVIVDDSYFDGVGHGPGWDQENTATSDKPYMAPVGAVSINHNTVAIYVGPGEREGSKARIELEPESDYFAIENLVVTVPRKSRGRLEPASIPAGDKQRIVVEGRLPEGRGTAVFYKRISNPSVYAGETLKAMLKSRGATVKGKVRRGTVPEDATRIYATLSPSLTEIVRELNKVSNNFMAEMLLKTLGAELKGTPGTWAKGVTAVEEYLAEIGIPKGSFVMRNGSGLNDTNRFSASQLTRLLGAVAVQSGFYPEYASSLGVAGRDGTLRSRMEDTVAAGRLRGKTGTLENVTALSGYVRLASGERYAYSIMVNDFTTRHGPAVRAVDALATLIATGGRPELEQTPTAATGPLALSSELRARVATFSNLARMADPRNLPFLRNALRTESDPVLRAVIAEAIYRADTEGSSALLLEHVPVSAETFGRLRTVAQEASLPTPILSSLIDVSAEGNADALDRLLTLAHLTRDDGPASTLTADGLQEIGRTAPRELFEALRRAPEETAASAYALLGRGLAVTAEKGAHPFLASLKANKDPAAQAAATAMHGRIEQALAQASRPAEPTADSAPAPVPVPAAKTDEVRGGG